MQFIYVKNYRSKKYSPNHVERNVVWRTTEKSNRHKKARCDAGFLTLSDNNGLNIGAQGRNRTGTVLPPRDFKSLASTNFATWADGLTKLIIKTVDILNDKLVEAEPGIEPR